ncbi:MAG: carbon storage regulator [Microbacteriaceae bacterium]|jgi:carbon storage regulator|nr:carbon storage regulator [Microbacteriaceae bacterium]
MLVLTRKKGERILIGDDIVVTLIDIRGDGVRIGFDAPRGVPIQRAEVLAAVTEANTAAAETTAAAGDLLVGLLKAGPKAEASAPEPPASEPEPETAPERAAPRVVAKPAPPRPRP